MSLGMSEMLFIFILALIIVGPKKLPEIGRQIGRTLADFKNITNSLKAQLEAEVEKLEAETKTVTPSELGDLANVTGPAAHIQAQVHAAAMKAAADKMPGYPAAAAEQTKGESGMQLSNATATTATLTTAEQGTISGGATQASAPVASTANVVATRKVIVDRL